MPANSFKGEPSDALKAVLRGCIDLGVTAAPLFFKFVVTRAYVGELIGEEASLG